jgi:nicotinamidase-related amidase
MAEQLDPRRAALVLYDLTQTLVEPGRAYEPWVVEGMPTLQRLLHGCRERGVAVFHAVNAKGFAGYEIPRDIAPVPTDTVFRHPESGAFYGTDFEQVLKEQGRDTLLIAGMAVDRGCNTTARDALNRGIRPVVVADGCFTYDLQESPVGPVPQREVARVHLAALHRIGALVLTTDEVLAALEPA